MLCYMWTEFKRLWRSEAFWIGFWSVPSLRDLYGRTQQSEEPQVTRFDQHIDNLDG